MKQALRRPKTRGERTSRIVTIPAPVGGWNARDSLDAMKPTDAVTLENFVILPGKIKTRPGVEAHAAIDDTSGLTNAAIETLMEWSPPSGNPKLFAATQEEIWDMSVVGDVDVTMPELDTLTNGRWSHVNFSTPGGDFLYIVNGDDDPQYYDGTAWTAPTITGTDPSSVALDPADFIFVTVHMNRLWFVQKNTRLVWFLTVQAIAGTAEFFDLSSLCRQGGELLAMASWTRDGGAGTDDYAVFVTSKGEVLVYTGTDPTDAATFGLVGIYKIPEPIGRRCCVNIGSELIILTSQGPVPLTQIMGTSAAAVGNFTLTNKITEAVKSAYHAAGQSFGWQIIEYPKMGIVLVNVPVAERRTQQQFIFSTSSGGWTPWSNINAGCWALFGDTLYFGGNRGAVYKLDGESDLGEPIVSTMQQAFTNLKRQTTKRFLLARARLNGPVGFTPKVHVRLDFDTSPVDYQPVLAVGDGSEWDEPFWDEADWGSASAASQVWQGVSGEGTQVSIAMRFSSTSVIEIFGTDLTYEESVYL